MDPRVRVRVRVRFRVRVRVRVRVQASGEIAQALAEGLKVKISVFGTLYMMS